MKDCFLLYIDILGFSDLVNEDSEKVRAIYDTINSLNVHKHYAFSTIIFSDTILVYNKIKPVTIHDHEYLVMYMCEFAQNLIFQGRNCNLNFRGIITYGEFEHYKLENVDCFYGKSLVYAYLKEKEINGVGLFIDNRIKNYNIIYESTKYNDDLDFVYLFQSMFLLKLVSYEILPLNKVHIEGSDQFYRLKDEIELLKKYFAELTSNNNPKVRAKYLQTYQFYRLKMPRIFEQLEMTDFSLSTINPDVNWNGGK